MGRVEEDEGSFSLPGVTISGTADEDDAASDSPCSSEGAAAGCEGTGGGGRWGTAGRAAGDFGAPVATGGGISASFTGLPFLTAASIVSRVCGGKQKQVCIITFIDV